MQDFHRIFLWFTICLKYPVSGRISGRISGIRHPPDIRPDIRYPVFKMAGYPVGRISGKTAIRSIPTNNTDYTFKLQNLQEILALISEELSAIFFYLQLLKCSNNLINLFWHHFCNELMCCIFILWYFASQRAY